MLRKLLNLSIAAKVISLIVLTVVLFLIVILLRFLPLVEKEMLNDRKNQLKSIVDVSHSLLTEYEHRASIGELSREEAQKRAMARIRQMRYGNNDYLWINDDTLPFPKMIMHPTKPELDGRVLDDPLFACAISLEFGDFGRVQDIPGRDKNLFQAFVEVVTQAGGGFVVYDWPRPTEDGVTKELYLKQSYVRLFQPWGWVIGTGVYVDDITAQIAGMRTDVIRVTGMILIAVTLVAIFLIASILRPMKVLMGYAEKVIQGNLEVEISGPFYGETQQLKQTISTMVGRLKQTIGELETKRNRLSDIINGTRAGTWEWNVQTGETVFNERWAKIIGHTLEEISPVSIETWKKFTHLDDLKQSAELLEKHFSGELDYYEYELRMKHKNGGWVWVLDRGKVMTWTDDGKPLLMMGTHQDITERKQADEALRESEEKYRRLFDNAIEGVFQITPDGGLFSANPSLARILGYNSTIELIEQLQDFGKQHYLNPADRETFRRIMAIDGETSDFEVQMRKLDGSHIWSSIKARAVRDETGNIHHFEGLLEDITKRKQAEEELKASERRARLQRAALSDLTLNQAFAEGDSNATLRLITRGLTQTLDISRASIWLLSEDDLKLSCLMLYESDKDVFSSGTKLQTSGLPRYFKAIMQENRIYAEDAQNDPRTSELTDTYLKPLGITSMLNAGIIIEGRVKGLVCAEHIGPIRKWFSDEEAFISTISALVAQMMTNTERRRVEEVLQESEERYQTILNEMAEGYHEVDLAGNFIFFNEAFLNLFGYSSDEMKGTNFSRYAAEEAIAKRIYHTYSEIYRTEAPIPNYEWDILRKDGERRTLEIHAFRVRDSKGIATGLRGIVRDITLHKQAEAEREKLQAQLTQAQKMESVGRLAGGVAHDFNNMIGVILANTEMAMDEIDPAQPSVIYLQDIKSAAERSADLTRQLLAFARKQTIAPKVLDLNETVESMLKMLPRLIGEGIHLSWLPGKELWPVEMDPSQIDQILANLCVNARDAINGHGNIVIETKNETLDENYCADRPGFSPGEFVLLALSDDGSGMDKETAAHIFEPFFTTKEMGKGTGLGLSTVYGIVKQNNGFINVYSEMGHGTTVKIYLPRHTAKFAAQKQTGEMEAPTSGNETILLVEDEPLFLEVIKRRLEKLGYTVLGAGTPGEAIRQAREHAGKIHLLMTDVVMPEMNGRDLAKNLMALYPDIKCLFMSGYTANVIAQQGVLDPGVQFIHKPFSLKDLAAKLRETLGGK